MTKPVSISLRDKNCKILMTIDAIPLQVGQYKLAIHRPIKKDDSDIASLKEVEWQVSHIDTGCTFSESRNTQEEAVKAAERRLRQLGEAKVDAAIARYTDLIALTEEKVPTVQAIPEALIVVAQVEGQSPEFVPAALAA